MYWIRILATKPPPAKATPAPRPVAGTASTTARPAAEPREKAKAPPARTPATATAAASNVGRATMGSAQESNAAPASVGDAPEPSALSSRGADRAAAAPTNSDAASQQDVAPNAVPEPDPGLIQVKSVQPEFPIAVVQRIHKGHVEVRFEVDSGGTVVDATVVASSSPRLNIAAVEAIMQWRFKPTPASHTALVDLVFDSDK